MNVLHICGSRRSGSVTLDVLEELRSKATSGGDTGLFERIWDKIKDLVLGTDISEAKSLLLSILSDQTSDSERLNNFRKLQRLERSGRNPALVETAQTDGATIRIMVGRGRHVEARRSVCLYERFIPLLTRDDKVPDLEWDLDAGDFLGNGMPWIDPAMYDDLLSIFDES